MVTLCIFALTAYCLVGIFRDAEPEDVKKSIDAARTYVESRDK